MNLDPALTQESIRAVEAVEAPPAAPSDLDAPALYINRELSWLEFDDRVLQLA
jgi:polyphosphate kinase